MMKPTKGWRQMDISRKGDQESVFYVPCPDEDYTFGEGVRVVMSIFQMEPEKYPPERRFRLHVKVGTEEVFRNHVGSMDEAKKQCTEGLASVCKAILAKLEEHK
jgi:hypothetical protein